MVKTQASTRKDTDKQKRDRTRGRSNKTIRRRHDAAISGPLHIGTIAVERPWKGTKNRHANVSLNISCLDCTSQSWVQKGPVFQWHSSPDF